MVGGQRRGITGTMTRPLMCDAMAGWVTGNVDESLRESVHLSLAFLRLHRTWLTRRFGPFAGGLTPGGATFDIRVSLCMAQNRKSGPSLGAALTGTSVGAVVMRCPSLSEARRRGCVGVRVSYDPSLLRVLLDGSGTGGHVPGSWRGASAGDDRAGEPIRPCGRSGGAGPKASRRA